MSSSANSMTDSSWSLSLSSLQSTVRLGRSIGESLEGGEVLWLIGDLGSGKTTLVQSIAQGAGIASELVSSPTFTFIQEYHGRVGLIHVDLYRLEHLEDLRHLGLSDYFDSQAAIAIEWADRAPSELPQDRLNIYLGHQQQGVRSATIQPMGPTSQHLFQRIRFRFLQ